MDDDDEYTCNNCGNHYLVELCNGQVGNGPLFCPYCGSGYVQPGGWRDDVADDGEED